MIFKNEEQFLPEFLSEHSEVSLEIILVDTGSTDHSVEICKKFNIEPLSFEWVNDFSKAKNFALEKASGDWILFLDADERIPKSKLKILLEKLDELSADAYRLELLSTRDEHWRNPKPKLESIQWHVRLFRNRPEYRYRHRIHENIVESLEETNSLIADLRGIQIFHLGYMDKLIESKNQRNIPLIRKAYEADPQDPRNLLYMAKWKINNKELFWQYLEIAYSNRSRGYEMDICEEAWNYLLNYDDAFSRIKQWEDRLLKLEPNHPAPNLLKARNSYKNQQIDESKIYYERVEQNLRFFLHGRYHGEVYLKLALLNALKSNLDKALEYLELENQWGSLNLDSWFLKLKILFSQRKAVEFVSTLHNLPPQLEKLDNRRKKELLNFIEAIEFPDKRIIIQKITNL